MFNPLRSDVLSRFTAVEDFFKAVHSLKGNSAQIVRGLAFVQIYAVYEYSVKKLLQIAVDVLVSHNHQLNDLTPSLMALFLDAELQSLQDCKADNKWDRRLKLFEEAFSNKPALVGNTVLPHDGSHFRYTQLQLIFNVLGIKRMPARRKLHLYRINEVVANRNEIAHGADTAENIGRRYSRSEVLHIIGQMKSVCLFLISTIEDYCADTSRHCRE